MSITAKKSYENRQFPTMVKHWLRTDILTIDVNFIRRVNLNFPIVFFDVVFNVFVFDRIYR